MKKLSLQNLKEEFELLSDSHCYSIKGGYDNWNGYGSPGNPIHLPEVIVTSGGSSTQYSFYDAFSFMMSSGGTSASWAAVAAEGLPSATGFLRVAQGFGVVDIFMNGYELYSGTGSQEDAYQILLAAGLLFASGPVAIVGGTALAGWELYEFMRDNP